MYARRGDSFLSERSILRHELSIRTGIPPAAVHLDYSPLGKPICREQPFNLSHSGDLLCIAFHHSEVGVDIELMRPRRYMAAIARRVMCPEQFHAWMSRDCPMEEFYACWCAAEALAKWRGSGIFRAKDMPFLFTPTGIQPCFADAPTIRIFTPAPHYTAAVTAAGSTTYDVAKLRYVEWAEEF